MDAGVAGASVGPLTRDAGIASCGFVLCATMPAL